MQVHEYLSDNPLSHLTISELAAKFHVAETSLRCCFKAIYGQTLGSINIDGSHLNIEAGNDFEREFAYDTHVIFWQDIPDEQASGKAWVYSLVSQTADSFYGKF